MNAFNTEFAPAKMANELIISIGIHPPPQTTTSIIAITGNGVTQNMKHPNTIMNVLKSLNCLAKCLRDEPVVELLVSDGTACTAILRRCALAIRRIFKLKTTVAVNGI
jgi:hypothetical protein